jgi:hypothetical protein
MRTRSGRGVAEACPLCCSELRGTVSELIPHPASRDLNRIIRLQRFNTERDGSHEDSSELFQSKSFDSHPWITLFPPCQQILNPGTARSTVPIPLLKDQRSARRLQWHATRAGLGRSSATGCAQVSHGRLGF